MTNPKTAEEVKYSEEKRAYLYRLASSVMASIISNGSDPTKEMIRVASDSKLNNNEIDRVSQKANVLLNEHFFKINSAKNSEHPLIDPFSVKTAISKEAEITKKIPVEGIETAEHMEERTADYSYRPGEIFTEKIGRINFNSASENLINAESMTKVAIDEAEKELADLKAVKDQTKQAILGDEIAVEKSYKNIKQSLKNAFLSGHKEAFGELYVAGCLTFPDREAKISDNLFKMAEELFNEGVMDRNELLKFASVPDEYFSNPNIVDPSKSILVELDTVTRDKKPRFESIFKTVDDKIQYIVKKIHVLKNVNKTIYNAMDEAVPPAKYKPAYETLREKFTPIATKAREGQYVKGYRVQS